jgi:hypothetical protein
MGEVTLEKIDLAAELRPENELERRLLNIPGFTEGLFWGVPRYGHPEGEVYKHIKEVLENIDRLGLNGLARERLRLIAFVHDTFKYQEDRNRPRDWSRHHGALGRSFLARHCDDEPVLDIVELHDEAYYCWRSAYLSQAPEVAEQRLRSLLERLGDNLQLYYIFYKCDTLTGDKTPAPLKWFEKTVPQLDIVEL